MKKIVLVIIAAAMVAAMVGCGNTSSAKQGKENESQQAKVSRDDLGLEFSATIDETVIVDEQGIKITAKALNCSSYEAELSLLIENNTDRNLSFNSETMSYSVNSVNGYMVSGGYASVDVAAGMSANKDLSFSVEELALYGIKDIADICVGFQISDDNYDDYLITGPREIKTSYAGHDYSKDTFTATMDAGLVPAFFGLTKTFGSTDEVFDMGGMKGVSSFVFTNEDGDEILLIGVENGIGDDAYLVMGNLALNGLVVSSGNYDSGYFCEGKRGVLSVNLSDLLDSNTKAAYGISDIGTFSMELSLLDNNYKELDSDHVEIQIGDAKALDESGTVVYDANGIQIISKGKQKNSSGYSDDIILSFLVKNSGSKEIYIDTGFDGVYVNKMKISDLTYGVSLAPGAAGALDVTLKNYDLEENNLTLETITDASIIFEIRDANYSIIDEPTVEIKYEK